LEELVKAKHEELGGKLQDKHDECDHGVSINAILNMDVGCE
jgi:hypothetical protein